ncbi:hypothetical protein BDQ12DRAFT_687437 [Crucibulum laeve]|uniref:DOMON domain-containing protein n=1 Tax=Crucibulum laeve TaxID=68775 RepID=A0A5C3LSQ4_9AGAR|nr:hypothetical protein BDQ12DRAFT_687437 [Crucibulum laeve]
MHIQSFFLLSFLSFFCRGETITIFQIVPTADVAVADVTPSGGFTISPGGVDGNGATTYVVAAASPTTSDSPTNTLVIDASHYAWSAVPTNSGEAAVVESCTLDGKGGGGCNYLYWGVGDSTTLTTSFTGTALPLATFIVSDTGSTVPASTHSTGSGGSSTASSNPSSTNANGGSSTASSDPSSTKANGGSISMNNGISFALTIMGVIAGGLLII